MGAFPRSVAITGLDTFCGVGLVERLLARPDPPRITGLDLRIPRRLDGRIGFHRVDLTEPAADSLVAELLTKEQCDAMVHAAFFSRAYPDASYAHELEVLGSLHVMNAAAAAGVTKLVVTSSAEVYGARPDNPNYLSEDHALRGHPDSPRIQDRVEMEQLLQLFAKRHPKLMVTALRPSWLMGASVDSEAIRHFDGRSVTTPMGFDPLMQLLHEDDYLRALELALERDAPGPINLAGSGVLPLSTLLRLAGKRARPVPHPLLYRVGFLPALWRAGRGPAGFYDYVRFLWVVDTKRATELLDFVPEYSTREAWMSFVVSRRLRKYR